MNEETRLRIGRTEPHATDETIGTACDGCAELDCIEQRPHPRSRRPRWRYYCNALGRRIDPRDAECPRGKAYEERDFTWLTD